MTSTELLEIVGKALYVHSRAKRLVSPAVKPQVAPVPMTFDQSYVPDARDRGECYLYTLTGR